MSDLPTRHANTASQELGTDAARSEGLNRLRTQFQQSDARNWMDASGKDAETIDTLVRGRR